jgi:hypothetical protein
MFCIKPLTLLLPSAIIMFVPITKTSHKLKVLFRTLQCHWIKTEE